MAPRLFTVADEEWLRTIKISPADLSAETVLAANVKEIVISAQLAHLIAAMYGEVNFDTWLAYRTNAGIIKTPRRAPPRGLVNWRDERNIRP
jgi:hypothetical protein